MAIRIVPQGISDEINMSCYNSVAKPMCDSGKGSENTISALTDGEREKYIDSMVTSPKLLSLLVTPSEEGFGKTRKGTEKHKRDSCMYQLPDIAGD